jgi:hypothetical protein
VRTLDDADDAKLIRDEAARRFGPALDAPFPIQTLTILAADFAENPRLEKVERRRFRRAIPLRHRAARAELSKLLEGRSARTDEAQLRAALAGYRDKVLVVVGHIPDGSRAFTFTSGPRHFEMDLELWTRLAGEERVNLIVIGCHSAAHAPLGAPDILNSALVTEALARVIAAKPATFANFFSELTSSDLRLTLDLFEHRLFIAAPLTGAAGEQRGFLRWTPTNGAAHTPICGPLRSLAYASCRDGAAGSGPDGPPQAMTTTSNEPASDDWKFTWGSLAGTIIGGVAASLFYGLALAWVRAIGLSRERGAHATGSLGQQPTHTPTYLLPHAGDLLTFQSTASPLFANSARVSWSNTPEHSEAAVGAEAPPEHLGSVAGIPRIFLAEWKNGVFDTLLLVFALQLILWGLLSSPMAVVGAIIIAWGGVMAVFATVVLGALERSLAGLFVACGVIIQVWSLVGAPWTYSI